MKRRESRTSRGGNEPKLRQGLEESNKKSSEVQASFSVSDSFLFLYRPMSLLPSPLRLAAAQNLHELQF